MLAVRHWRSFARKEMVHKLFDEMAPTFQNRQGGYTRIVKVGFRRGDAAPMCLIELISEAGKSGARKAKPKTVESGTVQATPEAKPTGAAPAVPPEGSGPEAQ